MTIWRRGIICDAIWVIVKRFASKVEKVIVKVVPPSDPKYTEALGRERVESGLQDLGVEFAEALG